MSLFYYLKGTQRLLREAKQDFNNFEDLTEYINIARRTVAERTQCVRRLTPIQGSVISGAVTAGGSGYSSSPTLTISTPDFPGGGVNFPNGAQATGNVVSAGGALSAVNITYGGAGYFQPVATITDATGTGGAVSLTISSINKLNQGQEVYPFSGIDLSMFPGVDSVFWIQSIAILYSNYRYALPVYSFSVYQSKIRSYPYQYQYVPAFASQYGQGSDGSFYVYPLPSQTYQMEFDCYCIPSDLVSDQSVDVIPHPWKDTVKLYAAHLAMLELQNFNAAKFYEDEFEKRVLQKSQYARPGRVTNPYGRY